MAHLHHYKTKAGTQLHSTASLGLIVYDLPVLLTYLREILCLQEARLWHRGSATLRDIENVAKLLKITRNDTVENGMCKFLLVFHCNYGRPYEKQIVVKFLMYLYENCK